MACRSASKTARDRLRRQFRATWYLGSRLRRRKRLRRMLAPPAGRDKIPLVRTPVRPPRRTSSMVNSDNSKELAMNSKSVNWAKSSALRQGTLYVYVCMLAVIFALGALPAWAQSFSSGSDGSDGAYNPTGPAGTVIIFDPSQFRGSQVGANIFNFTTITIPAGVTVKLSGNTVNGPVFWLAQGDVDIEGTVDLSGGKGYDNTSQSFFRIPSVPSSRGYAGGVGGVGSQLALPGSGTGGGAAGTASNSSGAGVFGGNQFVIPLVGGSGGGGGYNSLNNGVLEAGGGAGGGALMIAST